MPRRHAAQAAQPQPSLVAANSETATQPATQPAAATRSSRSHIPPDNDGEIFDFENELDQDDDSEDQADAPQARHAHSKPAVNTTNIEVNDPTPAAPKNSVIALDINYFYDRESGPRAICKECK